MEMISAQDVIRGIEMYFEGGAITYLTNTQAETLRERGVYGSSRRGRYNEALWPWPARKLATRREPGEIGVGDIVARIIGPGGEVFKRVFKKITGHDCGCADRQAALNFKYPLK
jgi:hypothetical protein